MNFAPAYILERFFYRLYRFLYHWYVKSAKIYSDFVLNVLGRIDYYLAWRITLRYLFQPLYKDYSLLGYVLGFGFRIMRLLGAGIFYLSFFAVVFLLYLVWIFSIPYAIYRILT